VSMSATVPQFCHVKSPTHGILGHIYNMSLNFEESPTMIDEILDAALNLEENAYQEGYRQGVEDGSRAGRVEGRAFGLEKGFEKFVELGRLHGRSCVWGARLLRDGDSPQPKSTDAEKAEGHSIVGIPANARLEKHIRTLYALTEAAGVSTQNTEDEVSEVDDRLKRAKAKMKVIEQLVGEKKMDEIGHSDAKMTVKRAGIRVAGETAGERNMEDFGLGR